jgi:hypothetical protein
MKNILFPLILFPSTLRLSAQELPEYNNSATAWNSKINKSISLSLEEGMSSMKLGAGNFIPMGSLFTKNKFVLRFQGAKSSARLMAEDTLRLFAKIDKDINPSGLFKIYRTSIVNDNREVLAMTTSVKGGAQRSEGDFIYTLKKISPGIFSLKIVGTKPGDELFVYIGTHDHAMAKLTLGID